MLKHKKTSHKGDNGIVLLIGGSKEYVGAIALAGIAALRSGCDLRYIAAPEKVAFAINKLYPDLITIKLKGDFLQPQHLKEIEEYIEKADVVLVGNGMGLKSKQFLLNLNKKYQKKLKVYDADALKFLNLNQVNNSILTPHLKEFEYLLKNSLTASEQKTFLKKILFTDKKPMELIFLDDKNMKLLQKKLKNNVILLKGKTDTIISKNKIDYNKVHNEGMTKGGTGDVLAGICAGFLAQTKNLFYSAKQAAYINGTIGNILLKKHKGYSFLASDMVNEISKVKLKQNLNK